MLFRLGAVLLGFAMLALFEGVCTVFDWGRPSLHEDPFVGFSSVRPLFVLDEQKKLYEIPQVRQEYFCPESFTASKEEQGFRIFCLGGSTVQGRPYAIETSFTTWLEISLQAADANRRWEVVNCGGVSYASYRLAPILQEVLDYEPDLIILYTGHNEFLEDREYQHVKRLPSVLSAALEMSAQTRTYTLLRQGYLHLRGTSSENSPDDRENLPEEVDALLDYERGMEHYHRDEVWRRGVIDHFRLNVRRMVQMAQDAGVPLILVNPVSNLRDSPPFKTEHRSDLTDEELKRWESLCAAAKEHYGSHKGEAVVLLEQARDIDPLYADTFYTLGKCYDALEMTDKARDAYLRAKELDICPLRILEPMNEAVLEIARDSGTPLVDARELFRQRCRDGIVGGDWLVDHVHPSFEGHKLLAAVLADEMVRLEFLQPGPEWKQERERQFKLHFNSLNDLYFHRGMENLKALQGWAKGRAERVRKATGKTKTASETDAGEKSRGSSRDP